MPPDDEVIAICPLYRPVAARAEIRMQTPAAKFCPVKIVHVLAG